MVEGTEFSRRNLHGYLVSRKDHIIQFPLMTRKDSGQTILNCRPHGDPRIFYFYRTYVLREEIKNSITRKNEYL